MTVTRPIVDTLATRTPGDDERQGERQLDGAQPLAARVAHAVGGLRDVGRDGVEPGHDVADEDQERVQDERDDRGQDRRAR